MANRPDRTAREKLKAQRARGFKNRDEAIQTLYDVLDILLAEEPDAPPKESAAPSTPGTTATT